VVTRALVIVPALLLAAMVFPAHRVEMAPARGESPPVAVLPAMAVGIVTATVTVIDEGPVSVTIPALYEALRESAWPGALHPDVVRIALCESSMQDGTLRMNPRAIGDQGRAWGLLQIRRDAHPEIAARHDLLSVDGALAAGWEVYGAAESFQPWSCW